MALENLKKIPRARLWVYATPLEVQHNLGKVLGVKQFLIKRDDCNGLAFGGNKVRQMEYYLGDALAKGCDTLLITGAVQSNFVRTAAAGCAKLGLQCHVQLENRVSKNSEAYKTSGNVLLVHLLGAVVHTYPHGEDEEGADRNLEEIAERLKAEGKNPYVVHLSPGHPPLGALGYVDAAIELVEQMNQLEHQPDVIFSPSGSGSTHGGLLYGLRALGCNIPVHGICVRRDAQQQRKRISTVAQNLFKLLKTDILISKNDIRVWDGALAPGYGRVGPKAMHALSMMAKMEGLFLDPVYTARTFAGVLGLLEEGKIEKGMKILFIHTGGQPALFAYQDEMEAFAK